MIDFIFGNLKSIWRYWYAGVIVSFVASTVVFYEITEELHNVELLDCVVGAVVFLFFSTLWVLTNRKKRNARGQIGICIAIRAESNKAHSQLEYVLVENLKKRLRQNISGSRINLISLPNHECEELDDAQNAAKKLTGRRSHLILFGRAVTGNVSGNQVTSIQLDAVVIHAHTSEYNSKLLSEEMRISLPKQTIIELQDDLKGYEMLSTHLDQFAKYVIAIAALLSGDLNSSERILQSLNTQSIDSQSSNYINSVVPRRILLIKSTRLNIAYRDYANNRDIAAFAKQEPIADEILRQDPANYQALLYKSIVAFAFRKDLVEAENVLKKCMKIKDATWMYNYAFVLAYRGNLPEAHVMYKRAFTAKHHIGNVPVESEEFIRLVMEKEPHTRHLSFAIGLINYNAKKDFNLAAEAFEQFVSIENAESLWPDAYKLAQLLMKRAKARA